MEKNEILLIEIIEKNPCLYDPKDPSYKDRLKRKEIWQAIAKDLDRSAIEAKNDWERLRRKYLTRRFKGLPSNTELDNKMSFIEGCCGLEQTQNRSVVKPQLRPLASSSSTGTIAPATSTNNSNHKKPATTSNDRPSSSSTSDNISNSTSQNDTKSYWLGLLFGELSQKVRPLPISKQLEIATQFSQICEAAVDETAETEPPTEEDCSYIA